MSLLSVRKTKNQNTVTGKNFMETLYWHEPQSIMGKYTQPGSTQRIVGDSIITGLG